ncbi:MAG: ABC transporter ATP-binding protein [Salana multivorans]|uniref:ABC transporter ATP-binding protein n=1 Tax=Salana multivorans TaxID=120377 RepID=UPI0009605D12|nr:ABC transporter ATP-binding protein [Salana multivorans]MBN8883048.1 ABC transporter ATP-binding protein [Salana multivorans]OJX98342.1 MAG: ABC transporter ATP-binding protein [Micrococcales bacterium 73-15]
MADLTLIEIENVSKRFVIRKEKSLKERLVNFGRSERHKEDFWALRDINLSIASGTTVGLIGHNGSGKSTLLKVIGGILQPTTGEVRYRGRIAALLELGAGFHPDLTGRENVYLNASILGLSRAQTDAAFDKIVDFSGIEEFIDTQVKFYSSGMYVRLAFAVATNVDPDILLVDEVLAVGDEPFQRKCLDQIRAFQREGRTIILVTHGLEQVAEFCDRAVVLDHGRMLLNGSPRDALRVLREDFEESRLADLERQRLAGAEETPQARARFTGFAVSNGGPAAGVTTISDGDELAVLFELEAEDAVPAADIEIGIGTATGASIYAVTTDQLGHQLDLAPGTYRYTLRLGDLHLAAGEYVIQATLRDALGRDLHRVPEGASFRATSPSIGSGVLALDASLDLR